MKQDDFDNIWIRIKSITGWQRQNDLADFLGVQSTGISGAKRNGLFRKKWADKIADKYDITTEEILYGKPLQCGPTDKITPLTSVNYDEFRISDKITKTVRVLESDTIYRAALAANIDAFDHAVTQEQTVQDQQKQMIEQQSRISSLETRMASLEKQLSSVSATPGDYKKEDNDKVA